MKTKILLSTLIVVSLLTSFIPLHQESNLEARPELRVMNFNTHFGVELNVGYSTDRFVEVIKQINPHVIGFEEITTNSPVNGFANMYGDFVQQLDKLGYHYYYVMNGDKSLLRNAIFSKIPFESVTTTKFSQQSNNSYIRGYINAEILFNNVKYNIIVTHLTQLPDPDTSQPNNIPIGGNEARKAQMTELVNYAKGADGHIIALGDFNFWPKSEEYNIATSYFQDSWKVTNPNDPGYTFPSVPSNETKLFGRRIDFVFITSNLTPSSCTVQNTTVSDHKPIFCDIHS